LFGEVGRGDDALGKRDAVVGQKNDFQDFTNAGVGVDDLGDAVDEADDELGHLVAGRGLGGENEDARLDVRGGVLDEPVVQGDDVEDL